MTDDLSALPKPVREALQRLCAPFDPFIQDLPLSSRDGSLAAARIVAAELLRMADGCATLKTQSIYPRAQLLGNLTAANERAERAEAELAEARETIKRLLGQNKVQYDFLSSRQCPDHAGKWERGKCLQCALEKAEAELAALKDENAQLRDVLADRDMDREMAAHANKELAALKVRIQWQPISTAPTDGTCILVSDADGDVRHAHWDKPGWWCGYDCYGNDAFVEDPTMWMPLPPPPKGEE